MMDCPFCEGLGLYVSHAEGSGDEDCYLCDGSGKVFDGMRTIKRILFMPKYVIDCRKCGRENHYSDTSCSKCRYRFT